jgi:hypothetical protein
MFRLQKFERVYENINLFETKKLYRFKAHGKYFECENDQTFWYVNKPFVADEFC